VAQHARPFRDAVPELPERCDGALAGVGALERIEAVAGQLAKALKRAA
jgi:hypothetical protein